MNKSITSSLIITTYNWHQALELVLESVKNQKVLPTEIIIADDGSSQETRNVIEKFIPNFPVPLIHVWHEDNGFRKSKILNKSIVKASGEYIIQVDGDCIIHKYFIADHLNAIENNTYLFGSRVSIQDSFLPLLFKKKIVSFSYLASGINKRNRNIHFPFLGSILYKRKIELSRKLRGCNLSYWKSDFIKVNGYNEDMTGWGREDSEFVVRMMNNGIYGKRLKFKAIIYHIFHNEKSKERLDINDTIQQNAINNKVISCNNGVDKYLNDKK